MKALFGKSDKDIKTHIRKERHRDRKRDGQREQEIEGKTKAERNKQQRGSE